MLESLNQFDHHLFLAINHWRTPFLDEAMPWITNRWVWIPLYVFLAVVLAFRFRKQTILIAVTIGLLVLASDQSANLLKNQIVQRQRPCYDATIAGQVITPEGCGGEFGFVSGHATNSCAVAVFFWLLSARRPGFPDSKRRWPWLLLFPWMIVVCWSRIYMGVHFPFDVLGGCMLGALWAWLFFFLYKKFVPVWK